MPTTTVNATYQGYVVFSTSFYLDWVTDVRDASTGSSAVTYTTNTAAAAAIAAYESTARFGTTGVCARTFLFFDVSSVPGEITAATLSVLGASFGDLNTVIVKSTAWANGGTNALYTYDYSAIDYNTAYVDNVTYGWTTTGYNDYTLNADAINDMNVNGFFNVAVIDYDYDYLGSYPPFSTVQRNGVEFLDPSFPIKLTVTYVTTPNIKVIGVTNLLTNKVDGILFSNISKVIGAPCAYTPYAFAWSAYGPCSYVYYDIYLSGDGKYYVTNDGGSTFSLMYSVAEFWYEYLYYDPNFMADVFNAYSVNTTSTVINDDGLFLANCF